MECFLHSYHQLYRYGGWVGAFDRVLWLPLKRKTCDLYVVVPWCECKHGLDTQINSDKTKTWIKKGRQREDSCHLPFIDRIRDPYIIYFRKTTLIILHVFSVISPIFLNAGVFLQIAVFARC
jgi:hypothetical protein